MALVVFAQVLLTILVVVGVGLLFRRKVDLDVQSIKGERILAFFEPSGRSRRRTFSCPTWEVVLSGSPR